MHVQVEVPGVQARHSHGATAFSLGPGLMEITLFGGIAESYEKIANTTVLRFGKYTTSTKIFTALHICLALHNYSWTCLKTPYKMSVYE